MVKLWNIWRVQKMSKDIEDIVKDCLSGKEDVSKVSDRGTRYCPSLCGLYKRPCRHMCKETIEMEIKFGNYISSRFYNKCKREE